MGLGTELCRCAIICERDSSYLVLTIHHAVYDGRTPPRIGSEVFKAHQGCLNTFSPESCLDIGGVETIRQY
jgi:hypothetical protein